MLRIIQNVFKNIQKDKPSLIDVDYLIRDVFSKERYKELKNGLSFFKNSLETNSKTFNSILFDINNSNPLTFLTIGNELLEKKKEIIISLFANPLDNPIQTLFNLIPSYKFIKP